jgi:hypothetical protein
MSHVTDEQPEPGDTRVHGRLLAPGLSPERIEQHLEAGRVYVDGERVTDLDQTAPLPARIVIQAS